MNWNYLKEHCKLTALEYSQQRGEEKRRGKTRASKKIRILVQEENKYPGTFTSDLAEYKSTLLKVMEGDLERCPNSESGSPYEKRGRTVI